MSANNARIKMKRGKKVMLVLGIIVGLIVLLMLTGFIINKVCYAKDLKGLEPKGQMVDAGGGKINIYTEGNGEQNIIILSGYGVNYPIGEYGPLQRELSDKYTVTIVDYMGTGFSSASTTERNNENVVEEIRTALKNAGIKPPYILMPHSLAGVYSQYYAIKYPDEISGMVLLDSTPTVYIDQPMPKFVLSLSKFLQNIGVTRLQVNSLKLAYTEENGYTKEEEERIKMFIKRMYNDTSIDVAMSMPSIIKQVEGMKFPDNIPVHKIISKATYETVVPKISMSSHEVQKKHIEQLGNMVTYEIIDAPHLMYQEHSKEIAQIAEKFIEENIKSKK